MNSTGPSTAWVVRRWSKTSARYPSQRAQVETRTRARTRPGWRRASSWAMAPPIEMPDHGRGHAGAAGRSTRSRLEHLGAVVGHLRRRVRPRRLARPAHAPVVDQDAPPPWREGGHVVGPGGDVGAQPHHEQQRGPPPPRDRRSGTRPRSPRAREARRCRWLVAGRRSATPVSSVTPVTWPPPWRATGPGPSCGRRPANGPPFRPPRRSNTCRRTTSRAGRRWG